jgi:hypothetical protein
MSYSEVAVSVIGLSTTLPCPNIVDSNFARLSFTKSFDMGVDKICDIYVIPNTCSICRGVISSSNLKEIPLLFSNLKLISAAAT